MKFKWESLYIYSSTKFKESTLRTKVKGGWIIKNCSCLTTHFSVSNSESMVFIPDPNHEWVIE